MLPTRFIGACELFVNFFKTAGIRDATIDELLELRSFLRNYLISHNLTGTYTVSCPLTREVFNDVAAHNPNIIEYVTREDKIRLKPTVDLSELAERNVLPPDIQTAITKYVNQNY